MALVTIEAVSKHTAEKELRARIRTELVATKQVGVWLEFAPKGRLREFGFANLEIASPEGGTLVSATLRPLKQNAHSIVIYFSTTPRYLPVIKLTLFVKSGGWPEY